MDLFYRELGKGTPIIILHGVFGSSDNWLTPAKLLADSYKLYLVDQRNHGQSPKNDEFTYTTMANDLRHFIEERNIFKPIIVGHSMGGKVAMTFASLNPEKLGKLIVVDIAPKYYPPHHEKILEGLNAINLKSIKSRQEADEILASYESELGVRQFLLKNLYRNPNNEFEWRINLPIITQKIDNVGEALSEGVRIDVPTLFIRGGKSPYISGNDEEHIRDIFSRVEIKTIEGAGHWVQAEKPHEFVSTVRAFA